MFKRSRLATQKIYVHPLEFRLSLLWNTKYDNFRFVYAACVLFRCLPTSRHHHSLLTVIADLSEFKNK
jgi:hypothetical protein